MKGISHREAAVLLECDMPDEIDKMFHLHTNPLYLCRRKSCVSYE